MVVTIWSHLWVVSGPARSLSITVLVSRPFAGSYRRMGWAVLGLGSVLLLASGAVAVVLVWRCCLSFVSCCWRCCRFSFFFVLALLPLCSLALLPFSCVLWRCCLCLFGAVASALSPVVVDSLLSLLTCSEELLLWVVLSWLHGSPTTPRFATFRGRLGPQLLLCLLSVCPHLPLFRVHQS